jgi:ATP-dependent Clp protease, protease subunit
MHATSAKLSTPDAVTAPTLANSGIYHFCEEVSLDKAKPLIAWILEQNLQPNKKPHLTIIISSYGGDLHAAFAIVDAIRGSRIPIYTVGLGVIASAGLIMFLAGTKKYRTLTPNTAILSHQFTWGSRGKEHELLADMRKFELTSDRMMKHYKKCTGLSEKVIREKLLPAQDTWLSAEEALELNICDAVRDMK